MNIIGGQWGSGTRPAACEARVRAAVDWSAHETRRRRALPRSGGAMVAVVVVRRGRWPGAPWRPPARRIPAPGRPRSVRRWPARDRSVGRRPALVRPKPTRCGEAREFAKGDAMPPRPDQLWRQGAPPPLEGVQGPLCRLWEGVRGAIIALTWALMPSFTRKTKRAHSWDSAHCELARLNWGHGTSGDRRGHGEPSRPHPGVAALRRERARRRRAVLLATTPGGDHRRGRGAARGSRRPHLLAHVGFRPLRPVSWSRPPPSR